MKRYVFKCFDTKCPNNAEFFVKEGTVAYSEKRKISYCPTCRKCNSVFFMRKEGKTNKSSAARTLAKQGLSRTIKSPAKSGTIKKSSIKRAVKKISASRTRSKKR